MGSGFILFILFILFFAVWATEAFSLAVPVADAQVAAAEAFDGSGAAAAGG